MKIFLVAAFSIAVAHDCASIPTTFWCGNADLEQKCGFTEACDRYRQSVKDKPISLTVLMEALCPDCQRWFIEELYPKIYKNFAAFVNIELVPYGNARIQNGSIVCQHGEEECEINRFESCLIDSVETQDQYVPLIYCIENQLKAGVTFDKASAKCFRTFSISEDIQRMIQSCLVSRLGERLQQKAAARTANVWPEKHRFVPWILYNNVSLGSAQALMNDLPSLICQWYVGSKAIPYCQAMNKKMLRAVNYKHI